MAIAGMVTAAMPTAAARAHQRLQRGTKLPEGKIRKSHPPITCARPVKMTDRPLSTGLLMASPARKPKPQPSAVRVYAQYSAMGSRAART